MAESVLTQNETGSATIVSADPKVQKAQNDLFQKKLEAVSTVDSSHEEPVIGGSSPANGWKPDTPLAKAVYRAGFTYDFTQDIIYSTMDNFQRKLGYCKMYDTTAIGISSVIDSEPVVFADDKYEWMIELWKGQYGIETGGEIGVYRREKNKPKTMFEKINGKMYDCIPNSELLEMSFELKKKDGGKSLFKRGPEKHWWLTGFRWGVFVNPGDVFMLATIKFKTADMMNAFKKAMGKLKYKVECDQTTNEASFRFDKPASKQPKTRSALFKPIQNINNSLVHDFNKLKTKLNISTNDPNEIDKVITRNGTMAEKAIFDWLIKYFMNRGKTG